jgi:hypothetical protein
LHAKRPLSLRCGNFRLWTRFGHRQTGISAAHNPAPPHPSRRPVQCRDPGGRGPCARGTGTRSEGARCISSASPRRRSILHGKQYRNSLPQLSPQGPILLWTRTTRQLASTILRLAAPIFPRTSSTTWSRPFTRISLSKRRYATV